MIRSILYYITGTLTLIGLLVFFGITLFGPVKVIRHVGAKWAQFMLWQLKIVCGLDYKMQGLENKPTGSVIFASKHQSAMETLVYGGNIYQGTFIVKRELFWVPIFGWFAKLSGMIGVNRSGGVSAMTDLITACKKARDMGKPFVLFPEGTRRPVLSEPKYKGGIYMMYKELNVPVVPIAHNAGVYWAKHEIKKRKGTVILEFLPAIETGLSKKEFMARLTDAIETKSNELARQALEKTQ